MTLKVITQILNSTLAFTGSQWNSIRKEVVGVLEGAEKANLAALFNTDLVSSMSIMVGQTTDSYSNHFETRPMNVSKSRDTVYPNASLQHKDSLCKSYNF